MIKPEIGVNTEVLIDEATPADLRCDMANAQGPCPVCGKALAVPYVWLVFEKPIMPYDFFVHPHCVAAFKSRQFFCQN